MAKARENLVAEQLDLVEPLVELEAEVEDEMLDPQRLAETCRCDSGTDGRRNGTSGRRE